MRKRKPRLLNISIYETTVLNTLRKEPPGGGEGLECEVLQALQYFGEVPFFTLHALIETYSRNIFHSIYITVFISSPSPLLLHKKNGAPSVANGGAMYKEKGAPSFFEKAICTLHSTERSACSSLLFSPPPSIIAFLQLLSLTSQKLNFTQSARARAKRWRSCLHRTVQAARVRVTKLKWRR